MISDLSHFDDLIHGLRLEEKEQKNRYRLDGGVPLKELKRNGIVLHPLKVINKSYGYADFPELVLTSTFPIEGNSFRDSSSVEVFIDQEAPIKGIVIQNEGKKIIVRLFAPDFPEWIEEHGIGLKLSPDERTQQFMLKSLELVPNWYADFMKTKIGDLQLYSDLLSPNLNGSQKAAIHELCLSDEKCMVLHGPPGTGKSTTLVELVQQFAKNQKKVIVSAPSNAAVNHLTRLLMRKVSVLRVGNSIKVDEDLNAVTLEGKWKDSKDGSTLKKWKIQAEELRKMSHQYKRNFGKDEREQRNLLRNEAQRIKKDIRTFCRQVEQTWIQDAQVILGTPMAIADLQLDYFSHDILIIDEGSQLLEPLFWGILPFAKKTIIAGDPYQLPPTLLAQSSQKTALGISILERVFMTEKNTSFLNMQYRMPPELMSFSNSEFYHGQLNSFLPSQNHCLSFYDTVGTEAEEQFGESGSICNPQEVEFITKIIEQFDLKAKDTVLISPYAAQVDLLKSTFPKFKVSTIDSFQGQESANVLISTVRSNSEGNLGFLKDYRRMNVALTRAKGKLFVIGDSATLGTDDFFTRFIENAERLEAYHSCYEL